MKRLRCLVVALVGCLLISPASAQQLPTSTPEAQGVSSAAVQTFIEALEKQVDAPHGFVLLRHGKVIARGWWSPYEPNVPHMLYSLSKSFTSTAIGMLSDEGKIDIDDPVISFFPDETPANPSHNLKAMRVRDLLSMTTGHAQDTLGKLTLGKDDNWTRAFLALPVEHRPGTHFLYNTGATYMLSAILQKITGQTVLQYLTPRLFEPLGIANPTWESDPHGINVGGWGLKITTDDIARFGQLYLQRGMWGDKRLISASWVQLATAAQTPNGSNPDSDWNQGYGFQFWRCRHNGFRGDGAFGQFCIVMPDRDIVLAINAGQGDMQLTLNLVYQHLLPHLHDAPLPADAPAHDALMLKLEVLAHPPVNGDAASPAASAINGKTYTFDANSFGLQSVSFRFDGDTRRIVFHTEHGEQRYDLGVDAWARQVVPYHKLGIPVAATTAPQPVAASAAWTAADQLTVRAWLTETPYRLDMQFQFSAQADALTLTARLHPLQGKPTTLKATAK